MLKFCLSWSCSLIPELNFLHVTDLCRAHFHSANIAVGTVIDFFKSEITTLKITGHFAIERVEKMALWISTADKQDLDGIPFTLFGCEEGSRSENYDPCIFSLIYIFIPGSQLLAIENESLKTITFFKKDILIASPLKSP